MIPYVNTCQILGIRVLFPKRPSLKPFHGCKKEKKEIFNV